MVYAKNDQLYKYVPAKYADVISAFLQRISPEMEESTNWLDGENLFVKVMSYSTPKPEQCKIEAHDKYIDIQATITGAEGISVFDRSLLKCAEDSLGERDVAFFEYDKNAFRGRTVNLPGYFTMLFPEDAHRPQEYVEGYGEVKKFVIKMKVEDR
ncbi:MAG: DUF386 domain-containing protein [Butyrivibrio sp.]|jgi:YhcH/YjgK/YiaL family protein|nr:DUF386 domain-containing protein [Butyrivibrio sp.]